MKTARKRGESCKTSCMCVCRLLEQRHHGGVTTDDHNLKLTFLLVEYEKNLHISLLFLYVCALYVCVNDYIQSTLLINSYPLIQNVLQMEMIFTLLSQLCGI